MIRVERGWDAIEGPIDPKSSAGRRVVPISSALRSQLVALKLTTAPSRSLVFGRANGTPFNPKTITSRAYRTWKAAKLGGVAPHEARHTYASLMIAAGVNAKTLS